MGVARIVVRINLTGKPAAMPSPPNFRDIKETCNE